MEPAERRNDEQRIDVNRPIELISMEGDAASAGYTRNLSAEGVRAWVDEAPDACANVLVRLSLVDGREPVDKPGRIVWCAPDIYGEGTDVGIQLFGEPPTTESEQSPPPEQEERTDRPPIVPLPTLALGQTVQIDAGGINVEARVEAIGEIGDDGRLVVQLALAEEQLAAPEAGAPREPEQAFDTEEWTPHPLRDAWRAIRRAIGPVLTVLSVVGHFTGRLLGWLWTRLPPRPRTRLEALWARIALPRRAASLGRRLQTARRWFSDQLAGWKADRAAKRSDETRA